MLVAAEIAVPMAAGQTQGAMGDRSAVLYENADRDLAALYGNLVAKITREGQISLQAAQATWAQFRDQECAFETLGSRGGSVNRMALYDCKARLTQARIAELKRQLNCEEGDVSCGNQ